MSRTTRCDLRTMPTYCYSLFFSPAIFDLTGSSWKQTILWLLQFILRVLDITQIRNLFNLSVFYFVYSVLQLKFPNSKVFYLWLFGAVYRCLSLFSLKSVMVTWKCRPMHCFKPFRNSNGLTTFSGKYPFRSSSQWCIRNISGYRNALRYVAWSEPGQQ